MNSKLNRIRKLESIKKFNADVSLYDKQNNRVNAVIQIMPTKDISGLALLPDGSTRGIYPLVSVKDIIFGCADVKVESKDVGTIEDTLFLRVNNTRCGAEVLLGFHG